MTRIHSKPEIPEGRVLAWRPAERPAEGEIGRTVDGVLAGFLPRIQAAARERAEAHALLAELLRHPPERREMLARNSRRFRNFPLCELLLQQSCDDGFDDPGQGEHLAMLALTLVESLDAAWYGDPLLAEARGRCWRVIRARRRAGAPPRPPAARTPRR